MFDFDDWARIAREDPQAFEERRLRAVTELIDAAPARMRKRLQGLQWRIDCVRAQSRTPLAACLRISSMMWDSVLGERGLVESLHRLSHAGLQVRPPERQATVLPFRNDLDSPGR